MIICNRTTKARRADNITVRGNTPAKMYAVSKPRRGGRTVCRPFWANVTALFSRGVTPACNLLPILGLDDTIAYN